MSSERSSFDQGSHGLPLLSVVSVTRQNYVALGRTLESLERWADGIEMIVVEGDDVAWPEYQALHRWALGIFPRLVWMRALDSGPYDAMNRGLVAASGQWVWFLNSGDLASQSMDESQVLAVLSSADSQVVWAIFDSVTVDGNGASIRTTFSKHYSQLGLFSGRYMACHQAVLMRRLLIANLGGFAAGYEISADYEMFLRCAKISDPLLCAGVLAINEDGGLHSRRFATLLWEKRRARNSHLKSSWSVSMWDLLRTVSQVVRNGRAKK